jgi:hypothetical protein
MKIPREDFTIFSIYEKRLSQQTKDYQVQQMNGKCKKSDVSENLIPGWAFLKLRLQILQMKPYH